MHWLNAICAPFGSRSSASRSGDHWLSRHPNPGKKNWHSPSRTIDAAIGTPRSAAETSNAIGPSPAVGHDARHVHVRRERGLPDRSLRRGGEREHVDQTRSPILILARRTEVLGRRFERRLDVVGRPRRGGLERQRDRAGGERSRHRRAAVHDVAVPGVRVRGIDRDARRDDVGLHVTGERLSASAREVGEIDTVRVVLGAGRRRPLRGRADGDRVGGGARRRDAVRRVAGVPGGHHDDLPVGDGGVRGQTERVGAVGRERGAETHRDDVDVGIRRAPVDAGDDPALVARALTVQHLAGPQSRSRGHAPEPRGLRTSDPVADGDRGHVRAVPVIVVGRRLAGRRSPTRRSTSNRAARARGRRRCRGCRRSRRHR